jgi:hypothetical protein
MMGYVADDYDVDWYSFDAESGDIGKSILVETGYLDTQVEVFDGCLAGTPGTSLDGPIDDGVGEVYYSSPITAAGTYYVLVSPSPDIIGTSYSPLYDAWFEITTPPTP